MANPVTQKDLDDLRKQIDVIMKALKNIRDENDKSHDSLTKMILEGDKVAEAKVEPVRKAVADLTKRVAALE